MFVCFHPFLCIFLPPDQSYPFNLMTFLSNIGFVSGFHSFKMLIGCGVLPPIFPQINCFFFWLYLFPFHGFLFIYFCTVGLSCIKCGLFFFFFLILCPSFFLFPFQKKHKKTILRNSDNRGLGV